MSVLERKQAIESALKAFASQPLYQAGMGLLDSLGYRSDRTLRVSGLKAFRDTLDQQGRLRDDAAKTSEWVGVEFLRQITSEDISSSAQGAIPFQQQFAPTEMQSYVFVAVELKRDSYTRTELSQITRAVNRVFDMPAMLLFKHGAGLTLAVISRRPNKRDETRDVLEKVTLVKDITYVDPLRAHIEILHDLSLEALYEEFYFHNFAGLHLGMGKAPRQLRAQQTLLPRSGQLVFLGPQSPWRCPASIHRGHTRHGGAGQTASPSFSSAC